MKLAGFLRALALLFLAAGLQGPVANAGDTKDSETVITVTMKDLLDFLAKLGDPSNPPSLANEVVEEVEILLEAMGIAHRSIGKSLLGIIKSADEMRKRLLKNPEQYGNYTNFKPTKTYIVKYAADVVSYIAYLRSDLWFLYFNTSDKELRRLCLLATVFHVPVVLAAADGATFVVSSTVKDMLDFLGKLETSSIKEQVLVKFGDKLKLYLDGIGFKSTDIQWNLTTLLECIPGLRLLLLDHPDDYGRFTDLEQANESPEKYADALAHCLPVLHGELWVHYLDSNNVALKRLCLRALGIRSPVTFDEWERDLLSGARINPRHTGKQAKVLMWRLYIWGGIFLVILIGGPIIYYIYKRPRKCDICRGCPQCCRCQSDAHCCCFCFRFWNRSTCDQCQVCTTCRRTQKWNIAIILFFELLLCVFLLALPIMSMVSSLMR